MGIRESAFSYMVLSLHIRIGLVGSIATPVRFREVHNGRNSLMNVSRWRKACAGLVCAAGLLGGGHADGQSLGTPSPSAGTSMGTPSVGTSIMPFPLAMPMVGPANLNSAASSGTDVGGNPVQGNIFANPYMVPFFYGSMMPGGLGTGSSASTSAASSTATTTSTSTAARMGMGMNQMGLLMMATQNPNGVGSGQMSGARGSRAAARTQTTAQSQSRRPGSNQPGGLAARYFNRFGTRSTIPRNYYNRQTRYFP